jgi:G6PDH family F420-dependent oxidoreductase
VTAYGYFLSSEEFSPRDQLAQGKLAEQAGFRRLAISDHYHPWTDEQGQSGFVWSTIGALAAATSLPITTAVTCPTVRIHPAVIAQAAATSAVLADGGFRLGVGSGEALNEHILGDAWPPAGIRQEMLAEAIQVMRELWEGHLVTHRGTYYKVDNARLYTLPEQPVPIYVSAFGEASAKLAGELGDGLVSTMPDRDLLARFRDAGGEGKPTVALLKVCWAPDADSGRKTAYRIWANEQLPGQLAQELPLPRDFEQAATLVTEDMVGGAVPCGPDPDVHLEAIGKFVDAGYDEVYVAQIGPQQQEFFEFYAEHVLPDLPDAGGAGPAAVADHPGDGGAPARPAHRDV